MCQMALMSDAHLDITHTHRERNMLISLLQPRLFNCPDDAIQVG